LEEEAQQPESEPNGMVVDSAGMFSPILKMVQQLNLQAEPELVDSARKKNKRIKHCEGESTSVDIEGTFVGAVLPVINSHHHTQT